MARRTGMSLELIKAWPELVGETFADCTRPEKIKWPRRASEDDPFKPATLIVACDGAQAIFLQHQERGLIENINLFFGFRAIDRLHIVQKPMTTKRVVEASPQQPNLSAEAVKNLENLLEGVESPKLRDSLEKLGQGVLSRSRI